MNKKEIVSAINIVILYVKFNNMEQEVSWVWEE